MDSFGHDYTRLKPARGECFSKWLITSDEAPPIFRRRKSRSRSCCDASKNYRDNYYYSREWDGEIQFHPPKFTICEMQTGSIEFADQLHDRAINWPNMAIRPATLRSVLGPGFQRRFVF